MCCLGVYIHTYVYVCIYIYIYTYTYTYTSTYRCIHIVIHVKKETTTATRVLHQTLKLMHQGVGALYAGVCVCVFTKPCDYRDLLRETMCFNSIGVIRPEVDKLVGFQTAQPQLPE